MAELRGSARAARAPNDSAEAYISEPCAAGSSTNSYVDLVSIPVPSNGVVHNTSSAFSKVVVKLKISSHGSISGTFEATTLPGAEYSCSSGVVTFTAKRT